MALFNRHVSVSDSLLAHPDATVNHEGGLAFRMDARSVLYTRACASLMKHDKFYTNAETSDAELPKLVADAAAVDPEFVLRLAAYVRQVMQMRSMPLAILVEAAALPACKSFVRRWTPEIVRRADEPGEVLAYWKYRFGDIGARRQKGAPGTLPFPNSLTKGLADALRRFDEYQMAKYDRSKCSVSMRDVLRVVRPEPDSPARAALYDHLVRGNLDETRLPLLAAKAALLRKEQLDAEALELAKTAHATWEVLTSKFGSSAQVWDALDLPFMAGMRNISNLLRTGADKALDQVVAMLRSPERVQHSKQLPFRFFTAYSALETGMRYDHKSERMVKDPRILNHPRRTEVMEALVMALEYSLVNLPLLSGTTFITADNSGSMDNPLSPKSTLKMRDVANLLASIAHTLCERPIVSAFGDTHRVVPIIPRDSIFTNMDRLRNAGVGYSTNAYLTLRHLCDTKTRVDRIILLSDMQCYGDGSLAAEWRRYRHTVNAQCTLYSVDLAGYGTAQFPQDDRQVALLAGWSEKLLSFIPLFEAGTEQPVDQIARWMPVRGRDSHAEEFDA